MSKSIKVYRLIVAAFGLIGLALVLFSILVEHNRHNYALPIGLA